MKVHVEVECSPEEARQFLGLPDVSRANDIYIDAMSKAMQGGSFDQLQDIAKQIAPMGEFGFKFFQKILESSAQMAAPKKTGN
jgi:hypothetical protein